MHTALIGASRGIGRATALDLLRDEANTVSLLLRSPAHIDNDAEFILYVKQGRVRVVKGDANEVADLRSLLDHHGIDSVVFTLGAVYPDGKRQFSWSKGFLLPTPDVCTSATLRMVEVLGELAKEGRRAPALVVVSVTGVGRSAKHLPYIYKLVLPWLLQQTIADKRGVEQILSHVSASLAPDDDPASDHVLPLASLRGLPGGFLSEVLVVRPAQLKDTDGTNKLRVGEDISVYMTGRTELGRWIAEALVDRSKWMNMRVTVGF